MNEIRRNGYQGEKKRHQKKHTPYINWDKDNKKKLCGPAFKRAALSRGGNEALVCNMFQQPLNPGS